ncbi:MAG: 50S ribosomal protein L24 [Flavobacteriales bacterium]|nr:50S ribosomal protein L24 [Flavobacteriales bacterium]
MTKLHLKKGDSVQVIAGEYKGEQGKVLEVFPAKSRAIVEGVNVVTKHVKPSAANPQGGITEEEVPIHISNLMVLDPKSGEPTRIGRRVNDEGKIERYSKTSGEVLK